MLCPQQLMYDVELLALRRILDLDGATPVELGLRLELLVMLDLMHEHGDVVPAAADVRC